METSKQETLSPRQLRVLGIIALISISGLLFFTSYSSFPFIPFLGFMIGCGSCIFLRIKKESKEESEGPIDYVIFSTIRSALLSGLIGCLMFSTFLIMRKGDIVVDRNNNFVRNVEKPFELIIPLQHQIVWIDKDITPKYSTEAETYSPGIYLKKKIDDLRVKLIISFKASIIPGISTRALWETSKQWKKKPKGNLTFLYQEKVEEIIKKWIDRCFSKGELENISKEIIKVIENEASQELAQTHIQISNVRVKKIEWTI